MKIWLDFWTGLLPLDQTQLLRPEADPRDDVIRVILGLDSLILLLLWDPLCFFYVSFTAVALLFPLCFIYLFFYICSRLEFYLWNTLFSVTVAVQGPENGCSRCNDFSVFVHNATNADSAAQVSLQNLTENSLRTEMPTVRELVSSCRGKVKLQRLRGY